MALRGVLHPRRARCSVCRVTHVLLPVTVLLRRAYAVEVIGAALMARAGGSGIGRSGRRWSSGGDGAGLAAGDERPVGGGADAVAGGGPPRWGGQPVPKALGSPWRSVLAALGSATTAVTGRFGVFGVLGPVTAWQVAAACSAGWLLSPGGHPDTTGDASRL